MTPVGPMDRHKVDAERGLTSEEFTDGLLKLGVSLRAIPGEAHWPLGRIERHNYLLKLMIMCCSAQNSMLRRSGVSPCMRAFVRGPKLPLALLSDSSNPQGHHMATVDQALSRALDVRTTHVSGRPCLGKAALSEE